MSILYFIVHFFLQAFALKVAAGTLNAPRHKNTYEQALTLSAVFLLVHFLCGFVPFVGWMIYLVAWCAIVMKTYGLSLVKSVAVAITQTVIGWILLLIMKFLGLVPSGVHSIF